MFMSIKQSPGDSNEGTSSEISKSLIDAVRNRVAQYVEAIASRT
jgi:hypothetical protein